MIYHPAFDIYHCVFRLLLLSTKIQNDRIEIDRIRIWDFYLTFPGEAKHITFPSDLIKLKQIFKERPNPYEDLRDSKRIFERMKPFQLLALKYLASYGLIDSKELENNYLKRTDTPIPEALVSKMNTITIQQENIVKLITSPFNNLPLIGNGGFKFRTKLIDSKYDIA
jgi:hypothetical protein